MTNYREKFDELPVYVDGEHWRIINVGTVEDGKALCHLANTTRGRQQVNGWMPAQITDWIEVEHLEGLVAYRRMVDAADRVRAVLMERPRGQVAWLGPDHGGAYLDEAQGALMMSQHWRPRQRIGENGDDVAADDITELDAEETNAIADGLIAWLEGKRPTCTPADNRKIKHAVCMGTGRSTVCWSPTQKAFVAEPLGLNMMERREAERVARTQGGAIVDLVVRDERGEPCCYRKEA